MATPSPAPVRPGRFGDPMAQLAAQLDDLATLDETVTLVVRAAVELLPGCDAASITVLRPSGRQESFAASSDLAAGADRLQHELEQGPSVDLAEGGAVTILEVPDLAEETRWPRWVPRVRAEIGVASVLSVPLLSTRNVRGALNLYATAPHAFDRRAVEIAAALGVHAGIAVRTALLEHDLAEAIPSARLVGQAQGLLMERFSMDPSAAFAVLRRMSQTTNVKVIEIARRLVEQRTEEASSAGSAASGSGATAPAATPRHPTGSATGTATGGTGPAS
ncbi:GAF and ANTAR domain-containing protein [Serinibacter arcticus]|uniref:ANTAR domain-containing protein n=1 Tax=Serinibacter arcticus TaxID=1655435 RepID=A0A4Z1E740_9MICO|nr:GAF and ANTAR domain-containing protein [Serinibacter arcticus]TGO05401.1 hypothetical protein SERN_1405 [Serinibacter arcticus]